MDRTISATEARIHFGELMRRVREDNEPYIVERAGEPYVVVVSVEEYERLKGQETETDEQRDAFERLIELGREFEERRGGEPLPDPTEIIREMREERTRQLMEACGWATGDEEQDAF